MWLSSSFISSGKIRSISLVTSVLLIGSAVTVAAGPFEKLQLAYHATFGNGSLDSGVDTLGVGELVLSDADVDGSDPEWTPSNGEYLLEVTRPEGPVVGPVAAGIFAVPLVFGTNAVVGAEATFIQPTGPHDSAAQWAVTVGARTGGEKDLASELRTVATVTVRGSTARLNVVGASPSVNMPNMPQAMYDAIFDPDDPKPFTIRLLINRKTGIGHASITVKGMTSETTFQSGPFPAGSGPDITAIGPTIANARSVGQRVSVRLRDFKIFTEGAAANSIFADDCPADFGCRRWPKSKD